MLQYLMKNAIVMPHGVDPFSCPRTPASARKPVESTPCTLPTKTKPDSSGLDPRVIQHAREKFSCRDCETITQPPAPFHVVARGWAGPSLLAMLLFEKLASTSR
jgi:transposase